LKIDSITVGPIQSNCYIVWDEKSREGVVIDPGNEAGRILEKIEEHGVSVGLILCTHGHFDHVGGVSGVKKKTGAKVAIHRGDLDLFMHARHQGMLWGFFNVEQPSPPDVLLEEGDEIAAGDLRFTVLQTPGHSPGGISLYGQGVVFTGDTVFAGSVGRTDLPGGSVDDLKKSFSRLMSLPPETKILPGHGGESTVGEEKETNFIVYEL
jgi:glyoxylase-like metal-dependent hydrolase (beta-lactamase superfamily II)